MTESSDLVRELFAEVDGEGEYPEECFSGSGIVICAGGSVMLANAYVLVRALRDIHKSALPVEIWHLGAVEMPGFLAAMFEELGCVIKDARLHECAENPKIHDGWQLKTYALKHSSFEQVILLDADQVPLHDPAVLLKWPEFTRTGAVFWPDVIDISIENPVWQMLGLDPGQVRSWESGQMCINKNVHWRAINLVLAINERAETFYRFVYGDKDTFLLAWQLTGHDFSLVPHLPFQGDGYLVQRDFGGNPLFQHHTNCKWSLVNTNRNLEGMQLFAECQEFLDELARSWDGYIFAPPCRTVTARTVENELVAQRHFALSRGDPQPLEVELLAGHQIGKGRSHRLTNWYVDQHDDELNLVLRDRHKVQAKLSRQSSDRWLGKGTGGAEEVFCLDALQAPADGKPSAEPSKDFVVALVRAAGSELSKLDCTLELLARTEPEIIPQIEMAAVSLHSEHAAIADHLGRLAAKLAGAEAKQTAKVRHFNVDDPKLYVRP